MKSFIGTRFFPGLLAFILTGWASGLVSSWVVAAEIDEQWLSSTAKVDFIDLSERTIVVRDRQFVVPFNTPIYSDTGKPLHLGSIKVSDTVTIYVTPENMQKSPVILSMIVVQ